MSFISLYFIAFVIAAVAVYYCVPYRFRYLILLAASLIFYATWDARGLIYVTISLLAAYLGAIRIGRIYESVPDKDEAKKRARRVFFPFMGVILALLVITKAGRLILAAVNNRGAGIGFELLVPLGISYYTFGVLGYLADVLWKKDVPEKNPLRLLLYMIYFPQIVEGPIPRHKSLAAELEKPAPFDLKQVCFGLQRALWGFFKKLVVADRAAIIVNTVFGSVDEYSGFTLAIAVIFSALNLYADFSGCMDIATGVSLCFGVRLDENFKRPFFSKNAAEFWRRWHITLGTWFKDYVCMPATMFSSVKALSKKARKKWGAAAGRNVTTCIALAITWVCTGVWHGTGLGYLLWGIYWGAILIFSSIFEPRLKELNKRLGIDEEAWWLGFFRMLRTFALFCMGKLITQAGTPLMLLHILKRMLTVFNPWIFFDGSLYELGLSRTDFWAMMAGLFVMWRVSSLKENGVEIRESIAAAPLPLRWVIYIGAVFAVMVFGYYGAGFDAASFVYQTF